MYTDERQLPLCLLVVQMLGEESAGAAGVALQLAQHLRSVLHGAWAARAVDSRTQDASASLSTSLAVALQSALKGACKYCNCTCYGRSLYDRMWQFMFCVLMCTLC